MRLHLDSRIKEYYEDAEQSLPLTFSENGLGESVRFTKNRCQPVHNWFHFKEGFSSTLLSEIGLDLKCLLNPDSVFVDPFCGSGTTVLAGDLEHRWQCKRFGIEINPFLRFVSDTKSRWREFDPSILRNCTKQVLDQRLRTNIPSSNWPHLSTFHNSEVFDPDRVSVLVDAVTRVSALDCPERDLLLLGIASAAERLGYYRKDGRALRILRKDIEIVPRRKLVVEHVLQSIWTSYAEDLSALSNLRAMTVGKAQVLQGDGRTLTALTDSGVKQGTVDIFAYSPPYLNHIDYTEVYKVELWLLKYVLFQSQMLALRKQTLRSHASYSFSVDRTGLPVKLADIVDVLADEIETTGKNWHKYFRNTALGYFQDMKTAFSRQLEYLKRGGHSVCVVANSAHGSGSNRVPVATDLMLARLAEFVGFEVVNILVARQTQRRDAPNPFLRESIIILRKA